MSQTPDFSPVVVCHPSTWMVKLLNPHSLGFKMSTCKMYFQISFGNRRLKSLCTWMSTLITRLIYKRFIPPAGNALWKLTWLSPLKGTLLGPCPQERVPVLGSCGDNTDSSALRSDRNWRHFFIDNFVLALPPFAIILPFVWTLLLPETAQRK